MANPLEFSRQYLPLAVATGKRLGVSPDILLGQWGLETGWGKSVIPGTNNLGNIKDFSGSGVSATDNMTGSTDNYRAFDTPQAFADHYASLIERKYPKAVGAGNDPTAYATALKTGGYAEDPDYVNKIAAVTNTVRKQPGIMERVSNFFISPAAAGTLPKNPFDQFDEPAKQANPFDRFDEPSNHSARRFDTRAAVNESLKLFPDSPDPITNTKALGAGFAQGISDLPLSVEHWLGKGLDLVGADDAGSFLVDNAAGSRKAVSEWADQYKDDAPYAGGLGRLGGNVLATWNAPAKVAQLVGAGTRALGVTAPVAQKLVSSIGSSGLRLGGSTGSRAGDLALRSVGGSVAGGAQAGLIDPESIGTGSAIGAGGPLAMKAAGAVGALAGKRAMDAIKKIPQSARRTQTIQDATKAGYVIPPSSIKPSRGNHFLESISGKAATAQTASVRNQVVTDNLARKALGVPDDFPLTKESLDAYRKAQYQTGYQPLKQLGQVDTDAQYLSDLDNIVKRYTGNGTIKATERPEISKLVDSYKLNEFDSSDAVEAIRILREDADDAFRQGNEAFARANRAIANTIEDMLERAAGQSNPDMLQAYRQARTNIAKSHTVQRAIREGNGSVDAGKIAAELGKSKPLTGELALIGRFANAFPKAAKSDAVVAGPGVSKLAAAASTLLSGGGAAALGPMGIAFGAIPFVAPPVVRAGLLSSVYQRALSKAPNAKPSQIGGLLSSPQAQALLNRTLPVLGSQ